MTAPGPSAGHASGTEQGSLLVARRGPGPRTSPRTPHLQIDQHGPVRIQAELWERMSAVELGWGEPHPSVALGITPTTSVMLFGPRDDDELELVWDLVRISYRYARGAQVSTWR